MSRKSATAATVGGIDALPMDVFLGRETNFCLGGWAPEVARMRIYLVDLPEGMSVETLAITVAAPEERFERFVEETAPIIESIELHVP